MSTGGPGGGGEVVVDDDELLILLKARDILDVKNQVTAYSAVLQVLRRVVLRPKVAKE